MVITIKRAAIAAIAAIGLTVGLSAPAYAREQDGILNSGVEFTFYYNSGAYGYGAVSDFVSNRPNLTGYRFLGSGSGKGQLVKNNAGAAVNTRQTRHARVFFHSNYLGVSDFVPAKWCVDLKVTKNENASFRWI